MAQNLNSPNDGIGSAGITAGLCGIETTTDTSKCEATTIAYLPASAASGALSSLGVSSTQVDGLDEGN
ncbi:MAG: hypothetical protein ABSD76_06405 [Terriglobales bacterium]|jgi:hypothetical protein